MYEPGEGIPPRAARLRGARPGRRQDRQDRRGGAAGAPLRPFALVSGPERQARWAQRDRLGGAHLSTKAARGAQAGIRDSQTTFGHFERAVGTVPRTETARVAGLGDGDGCQMQRLRACPEIDVSRALRRQGIQVADEQPVRRWRRVLRMEGLD